MASELHVDAIKHSGGTSALTIDSSGRVLQPSVPAFRVGISSSQSVTASATDTIIAWNEGILSESDNCFSQGGFSWSSGIVTVPLSGVYHFSLTARVDGIGSGSYLLIKIVRNNDGASNRDFYSIEGAPASNYQAVTGSGVFKLTANDTVRVIVYADADSNYEVHHQSLFSGHLVG